MRSHHHHHDTRRRGTRATNPLQKLRYTIDFFGPMLHAASAKALKKQLKKLQDLLGTFNDRCVREEKLLDIFHNRLKKSARSQMIAAAIGALVANLNAERIGTRPGIIAAFRDFSDKKIKGYINNLTTAPAAQCHWERCMACTIYSHKGGVSNLDRELGGAVAAVGNRVLLVDFDPQGAATWYLRVDRDDGTEKLGGAPKKSIFALLRVTTSDSFITGRYRPCRSRSRTRWHEKSEKPTPPA